VTRTPPLSPLQEQFPACLLCGAALGRTVVELTAPDRYERAAGIGEAGYRRRWVECPGCQALCDVHLSPEAAKLQEWATNYYSREEGDDLPTRFREIMALSPAASDNRQRVRRVQHFAAAWGGAPVAGGRLRVLDVGAGLGVFLAALLEAGDWEATALEPSPVAAAFLRQIGGFAVREELFTPESGLKDFDLITFNKVLEHIRQPQAVLATAAQASAPRGLLYVEVPHRLSASCHPPEHFILGALHWHLYAPSTLCRLLEHTGWTPLECRSIFDPSGKISTCAFACLEKCAVELGLHSLSQR